MEEITRIKIRLGDNGCVIQPEVNCKETITNSMSLNISKSEDGEISMQSIFLSEKKTLTLSGILNESLIHHQNESNSFKPDNNIKPLQKQLNLNSKNTHHFCSAISLNKNSTGISIKNTTVSSSKATSITSFKNASIINMSTSPFHSNVSNKSNSHSISSSFIEKGTFLNMNKIPQVQQIKNNSNSNGSNTNTNPIKNDYVESVITKIIRQRSLSSRGSRPTTSFIPASLSHRLMHITQANMTIKGKKKSSCCKRLLSSSKKNLCQSQMQIEDKRRLQYSSSLSSSVLLNNNKVKNRDISQYNKESNYSLVNIIIKNCLKKSSINSRSFKSQTSRSIVKVPLGQKRKASPNPSRVITNKETEKIGNKLDNTKKQVQTISNFSKYIRKSQTKNNQLDKQHHKAINQQTIINNHLNMFFNKGEVFIMKNKKV